MDLARQRRRRAWAAALAVTAFFTPLVLYLYRFGAPLSRSHERWAEFGSAMSGIYSPITAALTLALLAWQIAVQVRSAAHEEDVAYVSQARADIEFFMLRIAELLNEKIATGNTVAEALRGIFAVRKPEELEVSRLLDAAKLLDRDQPQLFAMWMAIYPLLGGLAAGRKPIYEANLVGATQKMSAVLSFEICVALDHFHWARTEGKFPVDYRFSHMLRQIGAAAPASTTAAGARRA